MSVSRRDWLGGAALAPPLLGARSLKTVRMGVVGGGFGAAFQWHLHPDAKVVAGCDLLENRRARLQRVYGCTRLYKRFEDMLRDREVDAVAIFTPPHLHVPMSVAALKAGKHAISAVPAALRVDEIELLLDTVKRTGLKYAMAETSRFRPEILTCTAWAREGRFGTIFYSEAEYHHLGSVAYAYGESFECQTCQLGPGGVVRLEGQGAPTWARGYPPMLYITHSTGMVVPVTGERLVEVSAHGWGDNHESLRDNYYKSPFWNSVALFKTSGGHSARISIAWHIAAGECERGSFYGDRMSYIMARPEGSPNTVVRQEARPGGRYGVYQGEVRMQPFDQPDHFEKLPEPLRLRTGHGNSHAFITHDFIRAVVEDRHPTVNAWEAAAYTVPGIVAQESALQGGALKKIRDYGTAPGA